MSEVLKKINNDGGGFLMGGYMVNETFEGKEQLTYFEKMYKKYESSNNILRQAKFDNTYMVIARNYDGDKPIRVLFEYIDN